MGEMKHTPGPWSVTIRDRIGITVRAADGKPVADIWQNGDDPDATSNLIAAAPDLQIVAQEALDTITNYLAYRHDGDPHREDARLMGEMDINRFATDGRLERLRTALSKAEGRSLSSASGQEGGE